MRFESDFLRKMTDKIIVPTGNPRYRVEFFNLFVQNGWKISVHVFVLKSKAVQFAEISLISNDHYKRIYFFWILRLHENAAEILF